MSDRVSGNERMSGVELLALYGDENEQLLGKLHFPKMSKRFKKIATVASMATPAGLLYQSGKYGLKKARKMHGDDRTSGDEALYEELLGAAKKKAAKKAAKKKKFLPGLGKAVKKVGKVSSGFTTGIAKAVGVPAPLLTALSKIDPTKGKKASATKAVNALIVPPDKTVVSVPFDATKINVKKVAIVGGGVLVSIIALKMIMSRSRR
jgi:hypothetical protein